MTHEPMDPQVVVLATVAATIAAGDAKTGISASAVVAKALDIITEASRKVAEGRTLNAAVDAKRAKPERLVLHEDGFSYGTVTLSDTVKITRYTSSEWYGKRGAAQVLDAIEDGNLWRDKPTGILDSNVWTVTITAKRGGGA